MLQAVQAQNRFEAADLEPYAALVCRGTRTGYRFISVYSRLQIVFTWFLRHPEHRLDVPRLLQGDV